MYNGDPDNRLTAEDHENGEGQSRDWVLVSVALIVILVLLFFVCSGLSRLGGGGPLGIA